jgi:regulator of sigma E protease
MSILIFFIILSVLVLVHELGHFSVARFFGIRVDEFGLGYPPRAAKLFTFKNTLFTLNWLPFGGFVKIYGEDPTEENLRAPDSFQSKNRGIQAAVLAAGVVCNFVFAWLLISFGLMAGLPAPAGYLPITNPQTVITTVIPGSPAAEAGLLAGDTILSINGSRLSPEEAIQKISQTTGELDFEVLRGKNISHKHIVPEEGIVPGKAAVGISMEVIGTLTLSPGRALLEGAKTSVNLLWETAQALAHFLGQAITGRADLASVAGPVGLVSMVGEARELGWGFLLTFTALISINLSIINLLPFPALDGGRLLFVAIEAVSRRRVSSKVTNLTNTIGFALLLLFMVVITVHDVKGLL